MAYSNKTGLPSVTQIIGAVGAHWLPTEYYTDESRERGSAVHAWCANYAQGRFCISLRPAWRGYCRSFKIWADEYIEKVILCEKRLASSHGYTGQIDLLCEMRGRNRAGLVDIKTGPNAKQYRLQVAAYRSMLAENHTPAFWGGTLCLHDDGSMARFYETPLNPIIDHNFFLSMFNAWNFFSQK